MDWPIMPIRFMFLRLYKVARKGAKELRRKDDMTENEISKLVVDLCFRIHKQYGPGLFESVYEEIFCYEWAKNRIPFKRQHGVPLIHEEIRMEVGFRADVIIDDKVIVELKSVESLADLHYKQVQTYLKLTNI